MIDIFGKIALTSCAVFMMGYLIDFFVDKKFPTLYKVNAIIGGANLVVGAVCAFVYLIAKIWAQGEI